MKNNRRLLFLLAVTVLAGLWFWRYTTMNAYYDSFERMTEEIYTIGEVIPFEDDRLAGAIVDGYAIRVDDFRLVEYDNYIQTAGIDPDSMFAEPEILALVDITLFNEDSDSDGIMLTDLSLHGVDDYVGMNWGLLGALNPILKGGHVAKLQQNTEMKLVLPYNIFKDSFGTYTMKHLDDYEWFLRLTGWPARKDIVMHE